MDQFKTAEPCHKVICILGKEQNWGGGGGVGLKGSLEQYLNGCSALQTAEAYWHCINIRMASKPRNTIQTWLLSPLPLQKQTGGLRQSLYGCLAL